MRTRSLHFGFSVTAAAVLLATAAAKLISATGQEAILSLPDPLLRVASRDLLVSVAVLEVIVAACQLVRLPASLKHLLVVWMGGSFLLYRIALAVFRPGAPCKCLGTLTSKLGLNESTAAYILTGTALLLLVGGSWCFAAERRHPSH